MEEEAPLASASASAPMNVGLDDETSESDASPQKYTKQDTQPVVCLEVGKKKERQKRDSRRQGNRELFEDQFKLSTLWGGPWWRARFSRACTRWPWRGA
jgi:hypothetical protein